MGCPGLWTRQVAIYQTASIITSVITTIIITTIIIIITITTIIIIIITNIVNIIRSQTCADERTRRRVGSLGKTPVTRSYVQSVSVTCRVHGDGNGANWTYPRARVLFRARLLPGRSINDREFTKGGLVKGGFAIVL